MKLPPLKIRNLESRFPVIQAGMGVRIGNADLAAATIRSGGFGTIASVGLGLEKSKGKVFVEESSLALEKEIQRAQRLCEGRKPLGVNIMVALSNYKSIVETSLAAGVDFIISGAGMPIFLPTYVGDADVALIPITSGGRSLLSLLKGWQRKMHRAPDAVIVEGPKCGAHLAFTYEMLENPETRSLEILFDEVKTVLDDMGYDVPILAAGEVSTREDIEKHLRMGYDGVQIGTRFIATEEAGIDRKSKEFYVNARAEDVTIIQSPVGMPVRVLKSPLVERILAKQQEQVRCGYRCLRTCEPKEVLFCIARALVANVHGDIENALFMTGCNVEAVDKIIPVSEFFESLEDGSPS